MELLNSYIYHSSKAKAALLEITYFSKEHFYCFKNSYKRQHDIIIINIIKARDVPFIQIESAQSVPSYAVF